ncbi:NAD(P)/FAD-dependent oxidoreductase [Halovenus rubra]|uniref:NAD(P)/FAD-dependent oxidoreductase n=2 Tax=Halovenus rubra TaxID=869890 RepID=A0ABD5X891_9EURY|nr:FAD-dependent oxidoreductase [Halovenus rubra]
MHVVVLGAGYAGVTLVRKLERTLPKTAAITLVDKRETHLVQHLLHRAVRTPEIADQLCVPLDDCCERATVRHATVDAVEYDAGQVTLSDGTLEFDAGAVCLGAQTAYYGLPGLAEHGTPLKRPEDAEDIRKRFLELCETGGRVVIGGAGLSGIQVAGELAELANDERADDTVAVELIEQQPTVAPGFPAPFQDAIAEKLTERGISIKTDTTVKSATDGTLDVADSSSIPYDQLVWTGGITGPGALSNVRPQVRSTLRLGQRTFGVGDAVRVIDDNGTMAPATAQTAVRQAAIAAENIEALVRRDGGGFDPRLSRYVYDSLGWVATVGDGTVAQVGSNVLTGTPAKTLKATIGIQHLAGIGAVEEAIDFAQDTFGTES